MIIDNDNDNEGENRRAQPIYNPPATLAICRFPSSLYEPVLFASKASTSEL